MSLLKKISNIASDATDAAKEAGGKIADTCKYSAEKVSELKDSAVKAVSENRIDFRRSEQGGT